MGDQSFHVSIRDRIASNGTTNVNAPRAETTGAEVEVSGVAGSLRPRAAYTYQRAVENAIASSRYVPIAFVPRHLADAQLTWEAPRGWALTGGARYVSRRFERDNEQGLKIPSYSVLNARLSKRILGAEIYLAGENLTDRRWSDAVDFSPVFPFDTVLVPQPGRTFWGGVTIRFLD